MPLQHLFGCTTVFHFSWNQHACEGLWFHEKWNTVCAQALSKTSSGAQPCSTFHGTRDLFVPKPCPIFHVTKPLARCAGSMKSGTRFCAQSNFRRPRKKRICFGSGRAEIARPRICFAIGRAEIAQPNIADMRSRNFCATAREADMRSRNFCATAREANYVVAQFLRDHSQSKLCGRAISTRPLPKQIMWSRLRDHSQTQICGRAISARTLPKPVAVHREAGACG